MKELTSKIEDGDHMLELWREFEEGKTPEAQFVKIIDKLEMMFQAEEYETEQPDKDLESFWEGIEGFDFGDVNEIFDYLRLNRTKASGKK